MRKFMLMTAAIAAVAAPAGAMAKAEPASASSCGYVTAVKWNFISRTGTATVSNPIPCRGARFRVRIAAGPATGCKYVAAGTKVDFSFNSWTGGATTPSGVSRC